MNPFEPKGIVPIKATKNKYWAKKVLYMGIRFDSKKEFERYLILRDEEKRKIISDLKCQVKYQLIPTFKHKWQTVFWVSYIADFVYKKWSETIVEDVKSAWTRTNPAYIIKKKLLLQNNPDMNFYENS